MPDINEMFPSKYLQAEDLPRGRNTEVTIKRVYPAQARQSVDGEPEIKWMMLFEEFRKPISVWKSTAKMIAEVLGTTRTEAWVGQRIAIYPSTYTSFGEVKACINVDKWKPEALAPGAGKTIAPAKDKGILPGAALVRFRQHLTTFSKTWDDFLKWCKVSSPETLQLIFGVDFDAIPAGALPVMKAYLDSLASSKKLETVNTQTGEVTPAAGGEQPANTIRDEDIPF